MAVCSYCLKDKKTVRRHMFDGMCADCTDKALNSSEVAKQAERNNEILKRKGEPITVSELAQIIKEIKGI